MGYRLEPDIKASFSFQTGPHAARILPDTALIIPNIDTSLEKNHFNLLKFMRILYLVDIQEPRQQTQPSPSEKGQQTEQSLNSL